VSGRPARLALVGLAVVCARTPALVLGGDDGSALTSARCFTGFADDAAVRACGTRFPPLRAGLEQALAEWRMRNAATLEALSDACGRGLAHVYRELRLRRNELDRIRRAAERFVARARRERDGESVDRRAGCDAVARRLRSETLGARDVEAVTHASVSLAFMDGLDPEFRRTPPPGAHFQRARGLHFRRSQEVFVELQTGTAPLDVDCSARALAACRRALALPATPTKRERRPSGEDVLTFAGTKTLFRGTLWDNHPVGREERVLVVRDGRVVEAWQSVQVLVGAGASSRSCEAFGGRGIAPCTARPAD
jgi:hypothetical protein